VLNSLRRWYGIPPGYRPQSLLVRSLHILALASFSIAQPLFDLLGRNSTFFAAHQSTSTQILLWALIVLIAPPACLLLLEGVAGLFSKRLQYHLHTLLVSVLGALFVVPPLTRWLDLPLVAAAAVFVVVGAALGGLYRVTKTFPGILTWASAASLVFVGWFLVATPTSRIVFESSDRSGDVTVTSETPVVMVVLDELSLAGLLNPAGDLNEARFPGFARLAATSTWYPNATTVHDQTRVAVTSILAGVLPGHSAVPISADYPNNLFTLLGGDYELEVHEAVTHLCPNDLCGDSAEPQEISGMDMLFRDSVIT
jgi:hypothetical protein